MDSHSFRNGDAGCRKETQVVVQLFCKFQTYMEIMEFRLMTRFSSHPRSSKGHKEQLKIHKFYSSDKPGVSAASYILLARFLFS